LVYLTQNIGDLAKLGSSVKPPRPNPGQDDHKQKSLRVVRLTKVLSVLKLFFSILGSIGKPVLLVNMVLS